MCGRVTLRSYTATELADAVGGFLSDTFAEDPLVPRYNAAPTQLHPVALGRKEGTVVGRARWGVKNSRGKALPCARDDSLQLHLWRDSFASRRCIIFADGFVEWRDGTDGQRDPFLFETRDRSLLVMAGLWAFQETIRENKPEWERRFSIMTVGPNAELRALPHDRMPVLLSPSDAALWLTGTPSDAKALLRTADDGFFEVRALDRRINNVKYDDPACLDSPRQGSLFSSSNP